MGIKQINDSVLIEANRYIFARNILTENWDVLGMGI